MKTLSGIILKILGWKTNGKFPNIKKSIVIFAPHTSYFDALYGKLYFMNTGVNYKFITKEEYFKFPLKYFLKAFGSIPAYKNKAYINQIVEVFSANNELHIILSPEGQLDKTAHWKKGFYYMSTKANIPIVVGYIDYKKKEMGIKGVVRDTSDMKKTMKEINNMYKNVNAKYPENFTLDKRFS